MTRPIIDRALFPAGVRNQASTSRRHLLLGLGLLPLALPTQAQAIYPSKPVRMITFFPPGGIADNAARLVAEGLTRELGQPVIVDVRPGAASLIAARAVLNSPPDGYTLMFVGASSSIASVAYSNPGFSYLTDFIPVGLMGGALHVLVVREGFPTKTVSELIAYAKANPGKVNFASGGNATLAHLEMETFNSMAAIQMTHVPYKGNGPALMAILAGDVDVIFDGVGTSMPHIRSGKLRALGIASAKESPLAPGIPPIASLGMPDFDLLGWAGLMFRAGTPIEFAERVNQALNKVLSSPDVKSKLFDQGFELQPGSRAEFRSFLSKDLAVWAKAIKDANLKID